MSALIDSGSSHLAVAEHTPDLATSAIEQLPVREVAHEARVVNRVIGPMPIDPVGN